MNNKTIKQQQQNKQKPHVANSSLPNSFLLTYRQWEFETKGINSGGRAESGCLSCFGSLLDAIYSGGSESGQPVELSFLSRYIGIFQARLRETSKGQGPTEMGNFENSCTFPPSPQLPSPASMGVSHYDAKAGLRLMSSSDLPEDLA
jgi:hypothetical protein